MNDIMDELMARVDRQLTMMRDLADKLKAVRGTAVSEDGTVTVTVDGNGAMLDLRLSEDIEGLSAREFGNLVTSTAAQAAREAFGKRGAMVTDFNEAIAENSHLPPLSERDTSG